MTNFDSCFIFSGNVNVYNVVETNPRTTFSTNRAYAQTPIWASGAMTHPLTYTDSIYWAIATMKSIGYVNFVFVFEIINDFVWNDEKWN